MLQARRFCVSRIFLTRDFGRWAPDGLATQETTCNKQFGAQGFLMAEAKRQKPRVKQPKVSSFYFILSQYVQPLPVI